MITLTGLMAKPWAPSHVSEVAKGLGIEYRISGDVKEKLVEMLHEKLRLITKEMEDETLNNDPSKKTLSDPKRTRLGFNRTRGLMIDEIEMVESVSSAAVVSANEFLEDYLMNILLSAAQEADKENVGTIKIRHLSTVASSSPTINQTQQQNLDEGSDVHGATKETISTLSNVNIKNILKQFSGKKIENDAVEEILLLYYDYASDLEYSIQKNIQKGQIDEIIQSLEKFEQLMMLGWIRRILKTASEKADNQNSKIITIEHIVAIDPWS